MKRVLSFLMTFALLITSFSNVAFAEEASYGEAVENLYANTEEQTVNLRMGQTVTCKLDGGIAVDNPNLVGLDTNIAVGQVIPGEKISYPYSMAKLATGVATFNGEEVELEECLFTFESSGNGYVISHTKEDGSVIYLASGMSSASSEPATKPCVSSGANLLVIVELDDNGMFTFNNKYGTNNNTNGYLYFHKDNTSKLHFNRNTSRSSDLDKANTSFDLFTKSEDAPADSEIKGYKKLAGLNEIVSGQEYLIAAKATNGNYYILNPVVNAEKYNYVVQVVTHEGPEVPGVQLASAQGNFNVAELKKATDCLFTFTSTGEANKYTISAETADGTKVYLNHKLATQKTPTTTNSAVITVAKKSDSEPAYFTLFDNSNSANGGYLYFHRGDGQYYNRNSRVTDNNGAILQQCYFELYKRSNDAPEDSPISGFAKVASINDIEDGGQYLIVSTDTNATPNYYFMYPSTGGSNYQHVAKLTDTMLKDENASISVDTEIIFTGMEEGETSVTVGGVTYRVIVKNEDRTITLRNGESTFISGTLQREVESQNVISIEETDTVAPYTAVSDVTDGNYLIGKSSYIVINSASSSTAPKGLAMTSANYTQGDYVQYIWKVTVSGNGYTIQDVNGKYINFTEQSGNQCSVVLSDTAQILNIVKRTDGSFGVGYGSHYINDFGETHTNAAGWSENNNAWYFYRGTEGVEVTSIAEGTATFTINGIDYTIQSVAASAEELQADITDAESRYAEEDYLAREWNVYETVLAEAKECVKNVGTLKQPEINAVRTKLANAIAGLIRKPVYEAPTVTELVAGAPFGGPQEQPFAVGTGGSNNFRIPAMITLSDGTIIAAADARWNHSGDACSIDIMVSKSTDNGETWNYSLPAFFNDSTNAKHTYGACFIDPVLVRDANDKIYMMVDLYPGGIAINTAPKRPHAASGFIDILGEKRLVLYTSNNPDKQSDTNYSFYVGDYVREGDKELAPVYEVLGENEYSDTASYYMDPYFYLYTAEKEPMYCLQLGDTTKKVQQNVFFYNSLLHVRAATYLYLITSEDKGETWSAPMLLNSQIRKDENADIFYGVGPGAGLCLEDGTIMLPAYTHSNERASFIYSTDGGTTWKRSQNATSGQSSESCLIQLDDTTVRHFYRSWSTELQYTDHTLVNGEWVAGNQVTVSGVARKANNQVSAIRYSKTIDGKPVIVFSTATVGGNYDRKNGKIYLFTVDMDAAGKPMELVAAYDNDPTTETDVYAYSSIAELKDGSIGLLYEYDDTAGAYKITYKTIPMSELAPEVQFDIPASEDGVRTEVAGYTLSLEGTIGVNFHMLLGEEVLADAEKGAYMNFTLDGKEHLKVPVTDATIGNETGYYVFKCTVPVKDMDTEITAQIVLSDGRKGLEYSYKVKDYADYILDGNGSYSEKTIELVEAMSEFGDYATAYFADETIGAAPEVTEEELTDLATHQGVISNDSNNCYNGSSLLLKSNTILRHYFTEKVTEDAVKKGDLYYIESEGIPAHKLGEEIVTEVGGMEITYNPLSYAYIALTREDIDDNLKNLMHAMYLYYQAAQAYLEPTTN